MYGEFVETLLDRPVLVKQGAKLTAKSDEKQFHFFIFKLNSNQKSTSGSNPAECLPWALPEHCPLIASEVIQCRGSKSLCNGTDRLGAQLLLSFTIYQQILHLLKPNLFEQLDRGRPRIVHDWLWQLRMMISALFC